MKYSEIDVILLKVSNASNTKLFLPYYNLKLTNIFPTSAFGQKGFGMEATWSRVEVVQKYHSAI